MRENGRNLDFNFISPKSHGRWKLGEPISSAAMFVFRKCCVCYSRWVLVTALPLCLRHVSIMFCSLGMTRPELYLTPVHGCFHFWARFQGRGCITSGSALHCRYYSASIVIAVEGTSVSSFSRFVNSEGLYMYCCTSVQWRSVYRSFTVSGIHHEGLYVYLYDSTWCSPWRFVYTFTLLYIVFTMNVSGYVLYHKW